MQKQTKDDDYFYRNLRLIILAKQGWTAPVIGMALALSRRVVQQRVYDYNEHGLEALREQRGAPPQSLLTPEQQQAFEGRIAAGPRPRHDRADSAKQQAFLADQGRFGNSALVFRRQFVSVWRYGLEPISVCAEIGNMGTLGLRLGPVAQRCDELVHRLVHLRVHRLEL